MRHRITQAWMTANWSRAKRMPHLPSVLAKLDADTKPRPQTAEEWTEADVAAANRRIMAAAMMWATAAEEGQ